MFVLVDNDICFCFWFIGVDVDVVSDVVWCWEFVVCFIFYVGGYLFVICYIYFCWVVKIVCGIGCCFVVVLDDDGVFLGYVDEGGIFDVVVFVNVVF